MLGTREYDALIDLEDFDLELGEDRQADYAELQTVAATRPDHSSNSRRFGETTRRIMAWSALTAAVLAGGLYAGFELRRRRLGRLSSRPLNPYQAYEDDQVSDTDTGTEYGAVGI